MMAIFNFLKWHINYKNNTDIRDMIIRRTVFIL